MKGGQKSITNIKDAKELSTGKTCLFESMMSKVMKMRVLVSAGKRTAKRAYCITFSACLAVGELVFRPPGADA